MQHHPRARIDLQQLPDIVGGCCIVDSHRGGRAAAERVGIDADRGKEPRFGVMKGSVVLGENFAAGGEPSSSDESVRGWNARARLPRRRGRPCPWPTRLLDLRCRTSREAVKEGERY
jgi:hypothetical protein